MNKVMLTAVSAVTALSCTLAAVPAEAQHRDRHPQDQRGGPSHRWQSWDGRHGYNGYHGKWRTGQRYSNFRNSRYYINDYRSYNLPPPRRGYRYYRDSSGDIVLAAIATGVIASIFAQQ